MRLVLHVLLYFCFKPQLFYFFFHQVTWAGVVNFEDSNKIRRQLAEPGFPAGAWRTSCIQGKSFIWSPGYICRRIVCSAADKGDHEYHLVCSVEQNDSSPLFRCVAEDQEGAKVEISAQNTTTLCHNVLDRLKVRSSHYFTGEELFGFGLRAVQRKLEPFYTETCPRQEQAGSSGSRILGIWWEAYFISRQTRDREFNTLTSRAQQCRLRLTHRVVCPQRPPCQFLN